MTRGRNILILSAVAAFSTSCEKANVPRPPLTCAELKDPRNVISRCFAGGTLSGRFVGDQACFPFSAPAEMTGLWLSGFEHSEFIEDRRASPNPPDDRGRTWLQAKDDPVVAGETLQPGQPRRLRIELIGRRSLCRFGYGHLGGSESEVLVDRFIHAEIAPPQ